MKKFSKSYIYYHLIVDFIIIFFCMLCLSVEFFTEEEGFNLLENLPKIILVFSIIFVIVYALKTIYSVLYIKNSGYELKENYIECKRGVFFKKRSILEYSKIHAVNKKQNLFHRLFNIAVLTLDSGSANTAYTSEILIIESEKEIDKILNEIKLKQSNERLSCVSENTNDKLEKENLYKFTAKRKVVYSLLNVLSTLAVLIFLTLLVGFTFLIVLPVAINSTSGWDTLGVVIIALYALSAYLILVLLVFIISLIASIFAYFKFRVYKTDNDIEINYGFFVKSNNVFKLNRIKGVVISQGLIKRFFGFVTVKLEVIGYSEANGSQKTSESTGVLFPLCKVSELEENLNKVLPEFIPQKKQDKAKKYFPFISWKILIFSAIYLFAFLVTAVSLAHFSVDSKIILSVIKGLTWLYFLVVALIMIVSLLSYKNNGIAISSDKITVYNGAVVRTCTVIKANTIIGIESITTPLRKKKGIYTFLIHFRSNDQTNVIKLNNVDESVFNKLEKIVRF